MSLKILSDYLLLVFIYKISKMTTSEVGTRNFINPSELFTGLFQLFPILKGNKKEILRTPFQFISWQMYFNAAGWLLGGRGSAISISIKYESSHGWRGSVTNSSVAADSWIIQKEFKAWQFHPRHRTHSQQDIYLSSQQDRNKIVSDRTNLASARVSEYTLSFLYLWI